MDGWITVIQAAAQMPITLSPHTIRLDAVSGNVLRRFSSEEGLCLRL